MTVVSKAKKDKPFTFRDVLRNQDAMDDFKLDLGDINFGNMGGSESKPSRPKPTFEPLKTEPLKVDPLDVDPLDVDPLDVDKPDFPVKPTKTAPKPKKFRKIPKKALIPAAVGAVAIPAAGATYHEMKRNISKSYVNGKWVPITALPKKELKSAVKGNRFGQKHLKAVDEFQNNFRNANAKSARNIRETAPDAGTVKNMFTGEDMQRTGSDSPMHNLLGPHVAYKSTPTGTHAYRPADKESMKLVKPAAAAQNFGGVRFSTKPDGIEAHEHAHGMARRSGPAILSSRSQRAIENHRDEISRVAAKDPFSVRGTIGTQKLHLKMVKDMKRQGLTEEARADVMASRKLGRTMVSGHVKDTGRAKDYLNDRHMIERGMGMKETPRRKVMYPVAPSTAIGATAVGGVGYAAYKDSKSGETQSGNLGANKRRVRKRDDMNGPFGVEVISKAGPANEKAAQKDPQYRKSYLAGINPRSSTYVKQGTGLERAARPMVGSVAGQIAGTALGAATRNPAVAQAGGVVGSALGGSYGLTRNLKRGDTVSYHKKTGKKANSKINAAGYGIYNVYG